MTMAPQEWPVRASDGHHWSLPACIPHQPRATLLWLPALGVAARHYLPFAEALAGYGIAVFVHEWRGNGSSSLRPSHTIDWGYRELLSYDIPASAMAIAGQHAHVERLIGGHSLGGQLACCHVGQCPGDFARLWLVASGTPYWRTFPAPRRYALPLAYRFLPWLARRNGTLPGRRLGFGGTEARGVIGDWARVGLSNHYRAADMDDMLETGMRQTRIDVHGVALDDDWLAPMTSLRGLLARMPESPAQLDSMGIAQLGARADHFAWMRRPDAVARLLAGSLRDESEDPAAC